MFGSKLRAWMEAVRPKKKQHRKDKQVKNATQLNSRPTTNNQTNTWNNTCLLNTKGKINKVFSPNPANKYVKPHNEKTEQSSRYSATNLSSPESAYSTGYSTDGTSPGAPPDCLINASHKNISEECFENRLNLEINNQVVAGSSKTVKCFLKPRPSDPSILAEDNLKIKEPLEEIASTTLVTSTAYFVNIPENTTPGLVSPRQRNRIRTNPWLPGGTTSALPSPLPVRQEVTMTPTYFNKFINSPIQHRYLSPVALRRSFSSSSCSSLSAGPNHSFDHRFPRSFSDEDDCTLNEMMGKYDESYVYEKETDILSDGDPTDCESDIDTGQDGGDEDDNADMELDFIDNSPYVEIDRKSDNTGHCLYFIPPDIPRKRSSRKRATKKLKESSDRRRKSTSSKKLHRHTAEKARHWSLHQDGSKSAGATPLSVRKSSLKPLLHHYKVHEEESLKKRSNSVSFFQRDTTVLINKRDREADLKYKELIGQAEQIIRTMNINGLSPKRLPAPTNKRVELLRSTECAKPDVPFKSKPTDENITSNSNIPPSTAIFKNNRFSPKKNHITKFIINNSPVLMRKELQVQSPIVIRRNLTEEAQKSPLTIRKANYRNQESIQKHHELTNHPSTKIFKKTVNGCHEVIYESTATKKNYQQSPTRMLSPRHRRATQIPVVTSSSEEEIKPKSRKKNSKCCPQSEPMRRKVYFGRNTVNIEREHGKTVAFNLNNEMANPLLFENHVGSSENLRHQVLLNTIQSLKRNLEDQSASLQQTYKSTQNMYYSIK